MIRYVKRKMYYVNEWLINKLVKVNQSMYNKGNIGPLSFETMVAQLKQREM